MIAVIDTETNWYNEVMSIGVVLAQADRLRPADARYYILDPAWRAGGMYESVLEIGDVRNVQPVSRPKAMADLSQFLQDAGISGIYAYNARFDCTHLPELGGFPWFDIMRLAAYRQYNPFIPENAPCCTTGRLRSGYGVEPITRMLTGDYGYRETHNALYDAVDELRIMRLLGCSIRDYAIAAV